MKTEIDLNLKMLFSEIIWIFRCTMSHHFGVGRGVITFRQLIIANRCVKRVGSLAWNIRYAAPRLILARPASATNASTWVITPATASAAAAAGRFDRRTTFVSSNLTAAYAVGDNMKTISLRTSKRIRPLTRVQTRTARIQPEESPNIIHKCWARRPDH